MFKDRYQQAFVQIKPDDMLTKQVLERARQMDKRRQAFPFPAMKPIAAVLAVCLCIFLTMPVLAANVEPFYQFMYRLSPQTAQFFIPVQKSDENNGIRMQVESAYIHGNTAEIYITMQDLTGDRLDGTIDLFDSYAINRPFDSSASCQLADYDSSTRTATFLINIDEWGNHSITGDKITFTVGEFLSGKQEAKNIPVPLDLSDIPPAETTMVSLTGAAGSDTDALISADSVPALIPMPPLDGFPTDGIDLTGIGWVNGKLHIQTAVKNSLDNDNHCQLYLTTPNGTVIDSQQNFYFLTQTTPEDRIDYCEFVFDLPQQDLSAYSLYTTFTTSSLKTEGPWKVTFPLTPSPSP